MRAWRPASCGTRSLFSTTSKRPFTCSRVQLYIPPYYRDDKALSVRHLASLEVGVPVAVDGWIKSVRKQKRVAFVTLGDGSTPYSIQAVLKPEDAAGLSHGTAVRLEGEWIESKGSKQTLELQVSKVEIQGENDAETNPLQPKYQTADYLRTIPHLRPRIPANALLLRLRSQVIRSITNYFDKQDFVQTHTPIITSSDCEGAGEVFTVSSNASKDSDQKSKPEMEAQVEHFFRQPKYLTVSAQLHLEALACAVKNVWTLSPTFRAEKSDTSRHLSEFYMLEAEQSFVDDMEEVMDTVEFMLIKVARDLLYDDNSIGDTLLEMKRFAKPEAGEENDTAISADELEKRWKGLAEPRWRRITYAAAIAMLRGSGFDISYGDSLSAEHERALANWDDKRTPIFVTDYPSNQKPFYMRPSLTTERSNGSPDTVACFDLLVPDLCELAGGSLREHRSKELLEAMQAKGVAGNNLEWYQDLRKYGSVPHGGFGLGFDRLLCYLAGVSSIRDVVAFPRLYGRCDC